MKKLKDNISDKVYTPEAWAMDMISHFHPSGTVLDPCRGGGVFFDNLSEPKLYCEIDDGVDFFSFHDKIDWIISNPPYSIFDPWLDHSLTLANDIVYLIPVNKILSSMPKMRKIYAYGGIAEIRYYGTGREAGFPFGFPVGAVHIKKNYNGPIQISWYRKETINGSE